MKPRLLFIPLHYNATPRPHEDWFNALSEAYDVMYYPNDPAINTLIQGYSLEYIFMQSGAIEKEILASLMIFAPEAKVIQWTGDCRPEVLPEVMAYKGIADLTLLVAGIGQKKMYEDALNSSVGYLQQGVFESFFIKPQELQSGRVVFIGNNYDHFKGSMERNYLCQAISVRHNNFEVIGNGYNNRLYNNTRSIPYDQSATVYNESYISISHACFNDVDGYYSNRTIDIMAAGGCCLMRRTPNIEQFFTDGYDCVLYSTNDEAIEKIKYLIERPEIRNLIALNGHNTAKLKHTFKVRVQEMKSEIEKYL